MNCSDLSCGFNSFIHNGNCECSYYDYGNPDSFCISPLEFLWYSSNMVMFICGTVCCIKSSLRKKRRTYENLYFENVFEDKNFKRENDFPKKNFI